MVIRSKGVVAVRKQGDDWYGDTPADTREVMDRICNSYHKLKAFADAVCECGGRVFWLEEDDDIGEAVWCCRACEAMYLFHDHGPDGYYEGNEASDPRDCVCLCDERAQAYFEITVGVGFYGGGDDFVRDLYIGCRCVACSRIACYSHWVRVDMPSQRVFANMRNRLRDG